MSMLYRNPVIDADPCAVRLVTGHILDMPGIDNPDIRNISFQKGKYKN